MTRTLNNEQLLSNDFTPDPVEEPQIIFRSDSTEKFNEDFYYGRRPKVELFWLLGIPGKWVIITIWEPIRVSFKMKDLYYYLDSVRLCVITGAVDQETLNNFKDW